jgi:hypothetical protein
MKTKLVLIIFAGLWLSMLCLPQPAQAQIINSCLKMIWPNDYDYFHNTGSYNPDSVMVDTCIGSLTYGKQFAKKFYNINFPQNYYPFDTILTKNDIKTVADISNKHDSLKHRFEQLENEFGTIFFKGFENNPSDSIMMLNPWIIMFFENYQDYQYIEKYFSNSIDSVKEIFYGYRAKLFTSVNDELIYKNNLIINSNPVQDILEIKGQMPFHEGKMQIISVEGIIVLETELKNRLDVSGLPPGMYFLRINNFLKPFIIMR